MAEYLIQSETLDDIADAINAKTGGSSAMTPAEMVTAIGSISGGGGTQTISFLDWLNYGLTTYGAFTSNNARITCPHGLYKCQSISIPTGCEYVISACTAPVIKGNATATSSKFVGFWNGTNYTDSYTWFNQQTVGLTEIDGWDDYYFIILLRYPNNTPINTNVGNNAVITFNYSNGAKIF